MEFSINTSYLRKVRGSEQQRTDLEAARIARAAGFTVLDCTPAFRYEDDYECRTHALAEAFGNEGLRVEQAHAHYNRYEKLPVEAFRERLRHDMETARILGTKYLVVHCDESAPGMEIYSKEAADYMYELFMPYVEYGAKHGIGIAIENTDTPPEFHLELIDRFRTDTVTACWDFGHGNYFHGKQSLERLKAVGSRLSCTHVHDNSGTDAHLPMYFGTMDWEAAARYLKANYSGVFTFEFVYGCIPNDLLVDYLTLARRSAERLFEQA